jgi:hypothetical protein
VPLNTPVVVLKVIPLGSAPQAVITGAGTPEAVTVNEPGTPKVKLALPELVILGGVLLATVSVVLAASVPYVAVIVLVPIPTAVASPVDPSMVATPGTLLVQETLVPSDLVAIGV